MDVNVTDGFKMPGVVLPHVPPMGPVPGAVIDVDGIPPSKQPTTSYVPASDLTQFSDHAMDDLDYIRRLRVPLVIKLTADQFLQDSAKSQVNVPSRPIAPVRSEFEVKFGIVKSLGHTVYDSALSGAFLSDESKTFADSLKVLIPQYTADWGQRAYAGTLNFAEDILPEYKKCKALREFAYIGVQSLTQLDQNRQALVTAEYKVFSEWMNFCSGFMSHANGVAKTSPESFIEELNTVLSKFETQIQGRAPLTGEAVQEEQVLFDYLSNMKEAVAAFSGDVNSLLQTLRVVSEEMKRSTSSLMKKYGNDTQRKALHDIINIFAKTLEDCFPAIFAYEQALLTWTTINARRAAEFFPDTNQHIKFAIQYFEAACVADAKYFRDLPNSVRLSKTLQMAKHRSLLRNGMNLPEHLKAWLLRQGVAPDQMEALPLDDRAPAGFTAESLLQADASYRKIDPRPMRFYVPALQTAIMWLTPDNIYDDTEEAPFDWNQNPWDFILKPDDQGLIVFGHGTSAEYSNSNAVLAAVEAMVYSEKPGVGRERRRGALLYDQIEHGFGPIYRNQVEPQNHRSFRRKILEFGAEIAGAHGKGAVTMGRSFAANESLDAPLLYGDLFADGAGYFATGSMSPYLQKWVEYTMQSLVEHEVVLNQRGDNWSTLVEPHWLFEQSQNFPRSVATPSMLTYSPDDIEYPPEVLNQWKRQFGDQQGYLVASFPGGYHDLFNKNDPFQEQKEGDQFIAHAARRLYQWYWDEVFSGQKPDAFPEALRIELAAILEARTRQAFIMGLLHDATPTEDAARNAKMANRIHRRQLIEIPVKLKNDYLDALRELARGKLSVVIQSTQDTTSKDQKKKRSASDLTSQIQELRNTVRNKVCQYLKVRFFQSRFEDVEWINLDIPAEISDVLWAHLPANLMSRFPEASAIEESGRFAGTPRLSGRDFDALLDGKYHKSVNKEFHARLIAFIESAVTETLEASLHQIDSDHLNPVAAELAIMTESLAKSFAPVVFSQNIDRDDFEMLMNDSRIQTLSTMLQDQLKAETVVVEGRVLTFGREVSRKR